MNFISKDQYMEESQKSQQSISAGTKLRANGAVLPFSGIVFLETEPVETSTFEKGCGGGSLSRVEVKFRHVLSAAVEAVFPRVSQRRTFGLQGFVGDLAYRDRVHARCHGWSLVCWSGASVCCQQTAGSSPRPRHLPLHQ